MKTSEADCAQAWRAEAVADGRLSDADAGSFLRHASSCEACARLVRSLEAVRAMAARLPVPGSTPLERRRLRNALLRRADALTVRPNRVPRARVFVGVTVAAALALAGAVWLPAPRPDGVAAQRAAASPTYRIATSTGARWNTREHGPTLRLDLVSGRFELAVDPLRSGQRFLAELPDGELEVHGTRFVVDADGVRTIGVRVLEGRVSVRLDGQAPLFLEAGERWPAATPAPAATPEPAARPATIAPRKTARATKVSKVGRGTIEEPSAGAVFAQAMAAFSAGDYGKADRLFVDFLGAHPGDARAEDARFLVSIARRRRGDAEGARTAAREYLRLHPDGLRRREAERLAF